MKPKKDDRRWVYVDDESNKKNQSKDSTSFEVNGESYSPYAVNKTYKIPLWVKACAAKWWFPGAVFYFISFGFEGLKSGELLALILGLVWGASVDILLNHFFRESSLPGHDYTKYIVCGRKQSKSGWRRFLTLPINLVYGVVISYISSLLISGFLSALKNSGAIASTDDAMFYFGALMFATVMFVIDLGIAWLRNLVEYLIKKSKKKKAAAASVEAQAEQSESSDNETAN